MRNLFIVLLALCLSQTALWSQKKGSGACRVILASQDEDALHNGVLYALPKTVIRVSVDADLIVRKAGPFYRFSQKYFNMSDVVKEDAVLWQIAGVSLQSVGQPDDSQVYKIVTDGYGAAPLVNLTADGILAGINLTSPAEGSPSLANVLNLAAPQVHFDDVPMVEEVMTKTSSAAMAEEAALAIFKLRKKRLDLLGGESARSAMDGPALQASLDEIARLEAAYLSLFKGSEKRVRITRYYDFIADQASPANNVLFRFSTQNGFVDRMDVSGTPVYIEVNRLETKKLSELPVGAKRTQEVNGLRYVLPGRVMVKLVDRNIPLLEQEMLLAQFGQLATLPVSLLQQSDVQIRICPVTGALLQVGRQGLK